MPSSLKISFLHACYKKLYNYILKSIACKASVAYRHCHQMRNICSAKCILLKSAFTLDECLKKNAEFGERVSKTREGPELLVSYFKKERDNLIFRLSVCQFKICCKTHLQIDERVLNYQYIKQS